MHSSKTYKSLFKFIQLTTNKPIQLFPFFVVPQSSRYHHCLFTHHISLPFNENPVLLFNQSSSSIFLHFVFKPMWFYVYFFKFRILLYFSNLIHHCFSLFVLVSDMIFFLRIRLFSPLFFELIKGVSVFSYDQLIFIHFFELFFKFQVPLFLCVKSQNPNEKLGFAFPTNLFQSQFFNSSVALCRTFPSLH